MVSRAWGTANGQTIFFNHAEGDEWEATVPWKADGEYMVEIFAADEAGNTSYKCTILFVIKGHRLQAYVVPRGYEGSIILDGYSGILTTDEYGKKGGGCF